MANCVDYCSDDPIGTPETIGCGADPVGGLSAAIILACNHTITDPSNGTQINSNLSGGTAWLFQRLSIDIPEPSPIEVDSIVPCETASLVTYDWQLTYSNPNISQTNITVHDNFFDGRTIGGIIALECGSDDDSALFVTWIDAAIKMTGGRVIPATNTEFQRFAGIGKWRSKRSPQRYPAPAGVTGFGN